MSHCDYHSSNSSKDSSGIIMATRGAIYIFRSKLIKGLRLRHMFNILKCTSIKQSGNTIIFTLPRSENSALDAKGKNGDQLVNNMNLGEVNEFDSLLLDHDDGSDGSDDDRINNDDRMSNNYSDDYKIRIDTSHAMNLLYLLVDIMNESLYGVKNVKKPKIDCDITLPSESKERQKHSLKRRAVFLSHYDHKQGTDLDSCQYFNMKWDGSSTLTLGREFHPTGFGSAFGRAVAWETALKTVIFRTTTFSQFSKFIQSLVAYSETIEKVVFLDYSREKKLSFDLLKDRNETRVEKWWFLNTCANVLLPFLKAADQLPRPFEELVVGRYSYSEEDANAIFGQIQNTTILTNIQTIKFISLKFNSFPYASFGAMMSKFQCLQTLYIKQANCDGNKLFAAICFGNPTIHQVSLIKMRFEESIVSGSSLPKGLVFLDVSKSQFINNAFASFLKAATSRESELPFIFSARKLKVGDEEFSYIGDINLKECSANFAEINFSHNNIPVSEDTHFFSFLKTQKKLKQIIFNDVTTDDHAKFIGCTIQLCQVTGAEGLDIGVHFEQNLVRLFISMLATCKNLTRLSIKNCGAGNEGIDIVCSLFNLLVNLKEFACDGFRPKPISEDEIDASTRSKKHPLVELWTKIGQSRTIERNDWPSQDLAMAQIKFDETRRKDQIWIQALKARKPPKTQQERIHDILSRIRTQEEGKRKDELKKANKGGVKEESESESYEIVIEEEEEEEEEKEDE